MVEREGEPENDVKEMERVTEIEMEWRRRIKSMVAE